MNRPGHDSKKFFLGTEVEHTPALGRKTLFVIDLQPAQDIQEVLNDAFTSIVGPVDHIYFGANHSFDLGNRVDWIDWPLITKWENTIRTFLDRGFWCTLDFDVRYAELVAQTSLVEYNTFIPMISVKIPQVRRMNYNAVVKIDDRDFAATNPGVWCHRLHDLQRTDCFTDWSQYQKDTVLR
jgi:hypothetical protein